MVAKPAFKNEGTRMQADRSREAACDFNTLKEFPRSKCACASEARPPLRICSFPGPFAVIVLCMLSHVSGRLQ